MWLCEACGREFAKPNQSHSCSSFTVDQHFSGRKASTRPLYDALIDFLSGQFEFTVDPVKTKIALRLENNFAMVLVQVGRLKIEVALFDEVHHERILNSKVIDPRRFYHTIMVRDEADLDDQLLAWIEEAITVANP